MSYWVTVGIILNCAPGYFFLLKLSLELEKSHAFHTENLRKVILVCSDSAYLNTNQHFYYTHNCWMDRSNTEWEVCLTLLHMNISDIWTLPLDNETLALSNGPCYWSPRRVYPITSLSCLPMEWFDTNMIGPNYADPHDKYHHQCDISGNHAISVNITCLTTDLWIFHVQPSSYSSVNKQVINQSWFV